MSKLHKDRRAKRYGHIIITNKYIGGIWGITKGLDKWQGVCACRKIVVFEGHTLDQREEEGPLRCSPHCQFISEKDIGEANKSDPLYRKWKNMVLKCSDKITPQYHRYRFRGIQVCPRWRNSFEAFREDMKMTHIKGDRLCLIDKDGDFKPENCEWKHKRGYIANGE